MATELASIVQSAHINHEPSVEHDINPSTAASKKFPADLITPSLDDDDIGDDQLSDVSSQTSSSSTIPSDIIRPRPRVPPGRHHLPLPDLRFEQTYLASLKNADTYWKVAYITVRDQVLMPLAQGVGYNLLMGGWRYWNRGSQFTGKAVGARVRRWWWGVNGWKIPEDTKTKAKEVKDFYVNQFGSSMGD